MRILVYPHAMEIGGSQLNAVELAGALLDRGHEVTVYSEPGPLVAKVHDLGVDHVVRKHSALRPGATTAMDLRRLVHERGIEVIHGWEWPPILEAYAASGPSQRCAVVGTVMSMSVAPFIPAGVPLTVGTERILAARAPRHHGPLVLMEPPVDTTAQTAQAGAAQTLPGVPDAPGTPTIAIVTRLVPELKLEGILTAVRAVAALARTRPVRLVVVGDGPAHARVAAEVAEANVGLDQPAVLMTGELSDPRPAYALADICLGAGGSALKVMSFAKPLVVHGEGGYFETLRPETAPHFLDNGWYGVDDRSPAEAQAHLQELLERLLDEPDSWAELGALGRDLAVDRYSLIAAAGDLEGLYEQAVSTEAGARTWWLDGGRSGGGLLTYKVHRRWETIRGRRRTDDFNAKPS